MSKPIVVLGMHRSATSLVAGGLDKFGVHMGDDQLGARRSNPKGHFEDLDFLHLNDRILSLNGGSWDQPPGVIDPELGRAAARHLVEAKMSAGHELWGWKDPRTALTYPVYEPYLGNDPHLVCVFRRPANVAASLHSRNRRISLARARKITDAYNRAILTAAARQVGLNIRFDP